MEFNERSIVEVRYRRKDGEWTLVQECIGGDIRALDTRALAHAIVIDLPMVCAIKFRDSPEIKQRKKDTVPRMHVALLMKAIAALGRYPQSAREVMSAKSEKTGKNIVHPSSWKGFRRPTFTSADNGIIMPLFFYLQSLQRDITAIMFSSHRHPTYTLARTNHPHARNRIPLPFPCLHELARERDRPRPTVLDERLRAKPNRFCRSRNRK